MKVYLSSVEADYAIEIMKTIKRPKRVLVTFYYLRNKTEEKIIEKLNGLIAADCEIMLDSGAFTFLVEAGTRPKVRKRKNNKKSKMTPEQYFGEYLEFIKKYEQYFHLIAELDIDGIVGYTKICEWWDELQKYVTDKRKLVRVFHKSIPGCLKEWENWAKEGTTLGIGGGLMQPEILDILFSISVKYNARVHGFAMTKNQLVLQYPWYSVDSSSWNSGMRYGTLSYYTGKFMMKNIHPVSLLKSARGYNKFLNFVYPHIRKYLHKPITEIIWDRKNSRLMDKLSAYAYLAWGDDINKLWESRGFKYDY